MEKLSELFDQAKEMSQLRGAEWSSALCESGVGDNGNKHHAIISDSRNDILIDTGSDSMEASWLCDYLELCSPANILAIAEAFRDLEKRAEAAEAIVAELRDSLRASGKMQQIHREACQKAEAKLAELAKQEPVLFRDSQGCFVSKGKGERLIESGEYATPYYLRPAPAADLAELVPAMPSLNNGIVGYNEGWNSCRASILHNIEAGGSLSSGADLFREQYLLKITPPEKHE